MPVPVTRLPLQLKPDPTRVISRLFSPGDMNRTREIVARVESFPEEEVEKLLAGLEQGFRRQHADLREFSPSIMKRFAGCRCAEPKRKPAPGNCSSALTSRWIMPWNRSRFSIRRSFRRSCRTTFRQGSVRFLMSLRAIGEGHVSSIVFRTGLIGPEGDVQFEPPVSYSMPLKATVPDVFNKSTDRCARWPRWDWLKRNSERSSTVSRADSRETRWPMRLQRRRRRKRRLAFLKKPPTP